MSRRRNYTSSRSRRLSRKQKKRNEARSSDGLPPEKFKALCERLKFAFQEAAERYADELIETGNAVLVNQDELPPIVRDALGGRTARAR